MEFLDFISMTRRFLREKKIVMVLSLFTDQSLELGSLALSLDKTVSRPLVLDTWVDICDNTWATQGPSQSISLYPTTWSSSFNPNEPPNSALPTPLEGPSLGEGSGPFVWETSDGRRKHVLKGTWSTGGQYSGGYGTGLHTLSF